MKTFLHKPALFAKMLCLAALLALPGWFVHAGGFREDAAYEQVKIVKFYPNPATSYINFDFPDNIDRTYFLEIYSFTGRKIMEVPVSANHISLTLNSDFYRGIYVFHLRDRAGKVIDFGKFQVVK